MLTQDNSNFFYDTTNKRLGLGTNAPKATLHNAGSTLFEAITIANLAAGGSLGVATGTVDIKTTFNINQTTANQTLTLANPTDATSGRIIYINNVGTVGFTMLSMRVEAGQSRNAIWNGTVWNWLGDQAGQNGNLTIKHIADQTVTNSTVLVNDTYWSWPVGAGETWAFIAYPVVNGPGTAPNTTNPGGIRMQMTLPGAPTNCRYTISEYSTASKADTATCNSVLAITTTATAAIGSAVQFYGSFTSNTA